MTDSWLRFENERTRTEGEWLRARVAMHLAIFLGATLGITALVAVVVAALRVEQLEADLLDARTPRRLQPYSATNAVVTWSSGFVADERLTYEYSTMDLTWQPCAATDTQEPTP